MGALVHFGLCALPSNGRHAADKLIGCLQNHNRRLTTARKVSCYNPVMGKVLSFSAEELPPGHLALAPFPHPQPTAGWQRYVFLGDAAAAPVRHIHTGDALPPSLFQPASCRRPFRLKVLHVNDLHGRITRLTHGQERPIFSRIVWRLRHLRERYRHNPRADVLFLSAGDDMAGSLFDELLATTADGESCHAGYRLYTAAGLNAAVLGNHDLDWGVDALTCALRRDAGFPLLSANLIAPEGLRRAIYPAALLATKGVRIAVIGLTTQAQPAHRGNQPVAFTDPLAVARNLAPALRPFCDVLILLTHLGYSLGTHNATVVGVGDVELAQQVPPGSVDLIVGGHTHDALNEHGLSHRNIVNGIPIVQAGALGRFLGEVTLTLNTAPVVTDARLRAVDDLPLNEHFEETAVQPLVRRVRPRLARPLGRTLAHPDLSPDAVQNDFAAGESALAHFVTAGLLARVRAHGHHADLAMIDASVVRDGLPSGPLTLADWFNVMPYADTVRLCRLTGGQLLALLHDNARRCERPCEAHTERGFLHFSGALRYVIELGVNRTAARAVAATVNGRRLATLRDATFTIACHSFFRGLAQSWERAAREAGVSLVDPGVWRFSDTGLFLRRELLAYVKEQGGVTAAGGAQRDGRLQIRRSASRASHSRRHVDLVLQVKEDLPGF